MIGIVSLALVGYFVYAYTTSKFMDLIDIDDFQKVDIRIGMVIKAEVPEWSHWVMRLEVDLGPKLGLKRLSQG